MQKQLWLPALLTLTACSDPGRLEDAPSLALPTDLPTYFDCIDASEKTLISAHRGGPALGYPENNIQTFKRSVMLSQALLEVDVATSADGVLYLHHDDTLDRTTTGSGPIEGVVWDDLRQLSLKDDEGNLTNFGLTRLDEALEWAEGRAILQLDFKRSTDFDDVAELVNAMGAQDRIVVIGYTKAQAFALNSRFPNSMMSIPVETEADIDDYVAGGIDANRILAWTGTENPNAPLYAELDDENIEVIFGTLGRRDSIDQQIAASGNEQTYAELASEGVDVIATDRPQAAYKALEAVGRAVTADTCQNLSLRVH